MGTIPITPTLEIDEAELGFEYSRSGGPGGQNVNKVNTKVALTFDVAASAALSEYQKGLIREKLGNRITEDGVLRVVSTEHRTQPANREAAVERFVALIAGALKRPKVRRPTKATRGSHERRLREKKGRSDVKRMRGSSGE
jgi:ribosome-associated protein